MLGFSICYYFFCHIVTVSYVFTVDGTLVMLCDKRRNVIWSEIWLPLQKRGI